MPLIKRYRFQVWVWEIAHGCTPFANRALMMETCAGQVEVSSWAELGALLDKATSVDGQKVSRVVNMGDMRSTGMFYDAIGDAHKAGLSDHPTYHLPRPTVATATPDVD
jgi:hypothetical protein